MNLIKKIWYKRWILRSIFLTIYFNFHYLPFKQAYKLPIIFYKPHFLSLKGKVQIEAESIKTGMITLGKYTVSLYPNSGIIFENHGGTITFKGNCAIGNNSAISIGKNAKVEIGHKFAASTTLRLVCYNSVIFSDMVRVGWECIFMDTDFHSMTKVYGGRTKGFGSIVIGKYNWFGNRCTILKNTKTPDYCTISATSTLNLSYDIPPYSIIGNNSSIEIKKTGLYRDPENDNIDYERK